MSESSVPIPTTLRLLVAPEHAGRIIGRRGGRVHEVQLRTGARIQLSDQGAEKKIEISGSQSCVDDAVSMMLQDLSPPVKEQQHPKAQTSSSVFVAVIIPEALAPWVSGALGQRSGLEMDDLSVSVQNTWGEVSERKVALQGAVDLVIEALRLVNLHVQRHSYWGFAGLRELPWNSGDLWQEGDPEESFISTVNFRLMLSERVAQALIEKGFASTLLPQIQEDTGAVVRRHAGPPPGIEIAGGFGAKLRALMGVSIMLLNLDSDSGGGLQLLLPAAGPSSLKSSKVQELAKGQDVESSVKKAGDNVLVRLSGSRDACSAAAVAVYRTTERGAKEHERTHGPPPLLIDYLSRWFGRDATRFQGGFFAGPARSRANEFAIPVSQLADRGPHALVGRQHEPSRAAGGQSADNPQPAAAPAARAYGPALERPRQDDDPAKSEKGSTHRDRSASEGGDEKRRRMKRRRSRLYNPFEAWRPGPEAAGEAALAAEGPVASPGVVVAVAGATHGMDDVSGVASTEVCPPPTGDPPAFLAGYSDDDSDRPLAPVAGDVSDGDELEPVRSGADTWPLEEPEPGAALPDGGDDDDFFWGTGDPEAAGEPGGPPAGMQLSPWAPQLLEVSAAPAPLLLLQQGDPLTERKRSLLEKLAQL